MCFPCAHHVVSRWTPFGFQVDTMWFPGGQHRVSKVDTMWFLQDTTGFPHGCHVVSIWTPCVVEVTTWKPAQETALHEANWLPCLTFVCLISVSPDDDVEVDLDLSTLLIFYFLDFFCFFVSLAAGDHDSDALCTRDFSCLHLWPLSCICKIILQNFLLNWKWREVIWYMKLRQQSL